MQKLLKRLPILDIPEHLLYPGGLSDVIDGALYREFVSSTASSGPNTSFTVNANETLYNRSGATLTWPIQLFTYEVQPKRCMNRLAFAALGMGKTRKDEVVPGCYYEGNELAW